MKLGIILCFTTYILGFTSNLEARDINLRSIIRSKRQAKPQVYGFCKADLDNTPWLIHLEIPPLNKKCSGALISKRFILTSAQCLVDLRSQRTVLPDQIWLTTMDGHRYTKAVKRAMPNGDFEIYARRYNIEDYPYTIAASDVGLVLLHKKWWLGRLRFIKNAPLHLAPVNVLPFQPRYEYFPDKGQQNADTANCHVVNAQRNTVVAVDVYEHDGVLQAAYGQTYMNGPANEDIAVILVAGTVVPFALGTTRLMVGGEAGAVLVCGPKKALAGVLSMTWGDTEGQEPPIYGGEGVIAAVHRIQTPQFRNWLRVYTYV